MSRGKAVRAQEIIDKAIAEGRISPEGFESFTAAQEAYERQWWADVKALGRELAGQRRHSLNLPEATWLAIAEEVMASDWIARFERKPDEIPTTVPAIDPYDASPPRTETIDERPEGVEGDRR